MDFLEKDLERIIFEASDNQLNNAGLYVCGKRYRQLRIGNYGIADMVTFKKRYYRDYDAQKTDTSRFILEITVYELKRNQIGIGAFLQAVGYVKGIEQYIYKNERFRHCDLRYNIVLIGKEVESSGSFCFLPDILDNDISSEDDFRYIGKMLPLRLSFYTYKYSIDGLKFKSKQGYSLKNEGF